jgi:hypothetical protein
VHYLRETSTFLIEEGFGSRPLVVAFVDTRPPVFLTHTCLRANIQSVMSSREAVTLLGDNRRYTGFVFFGA